MDLSRKRLKSFFWFKLVLSFVPLGFIYQVSCKGRFEKKNVQNVISLLLAGSDKQQWLSNILDVNATFDKVNKEHNNTSVIHLLGQNQSTISIFPCCCYFHEKKKVPGVIVKTLQTF